MLMRALMLLSVKKGPHDRIVSSGTATSSLLTTSRCPVQFESCAIHPYSIPPSSIIADLPATCAYCVAGKGLGLSVAPYAAGHLIGGAVWRISLDGEDILYAMDYNHRKERHLNGAVLGSVCSRPAVLITGVCSPVSATDNPMHCTVTLAKIFGASLEPPQAAGSEMSAA